MENETAQATERRKLKESPSSPARSASSEPEDTPIDRPPFRCELVRVPPPRDRHGHVPQPVADLIFPLPDGVEVVLVRVDLGLPRLAEVVLHLLVQFVAVGGEEGTAEYRVIGPVSRQFAQELA